jgi:hypothetical protein
VYNTWSFYNGEKHSITATKRLNMNPLAVKYLILFVTISSLFLYIIIFKHSKIPDENFLVISKLIKLPSISFSTSYIENRLYEYDDNSNTFYIGVKRNDYRGFVYVK